MATPRFAQLSLRTIFEAVFVVAVVLAFFYWRTVPHVAAGRYQVQPLSGERALFIDTATGKMWRGTPARSGNWTPVKSPVDGPK